ncbi:MAG: SPFH/Band 7/PHB domain protein [Clostridiales bacterium]|nr:SPFH/Band 7/PHB domain protein [Clostridiales bacterium]
MLGYLILLIVIILLTVLIIVNVRIVPQANAFVIERLGGYLKTWSVGLHIKLPLLDRVAQRVDLKEKVIDFPPQPVITKDNVTMKIDTVVFYQITDPKLYAYGVAQPILAIENLTATTLRNIIGQLELDETLTSRDLINVQMRSTLDEATDPWGIRVNRVEVKNILPPDDIQNAMEKQMRAERERRESILRAEGEKRSAILIAEGKKESQILYAEGEKTANILKAEAKKEAAIRVAEGEALAIKMIKEAGPTKEILTLRSFDALVDVANGNATKIIIPSEIQSMAGLATSLKELIVKNEA